MVHQQSSQASRQRVSKLHDSLLDLQRPAYGVRPQNRERAGSCLDQLESSSAFTNGASHLGPVAHRQRCFSGEANLSVENQVTRTAQGEVGMQIEWIRKRASAKLSTQRCVRTHDLHQTLSQSRVSTNADTAR